MPAHSRFNEESPSINYSSVHSHTSLAKAQERVKTSSCCIRGTFIALLFLTVIGMISSFDDLDSQLWKNHRLQDWCLEETEGDASCRVRLMLNAMTILSFIIEFFCKIVAIVFYASGIRASKAKTAARAASLYRFFWIQVIVLGVLVIA